MDISGKAFPPLERDPNVNVLCLRVDTNVRFCCLTDQLQVLILTKIYSGHTTISPIFIPRDLEAPRTVHDRT